VDCQIGSVFGSARWVAPGITLVKSQLFPRENTVVAEHLEKRASNKAH
jgi:hypothetical protein